MSRLLRFCGRFAAALHTRAIVLLRSIEACIAAHTAQRLMLSSLLANILTAVSAERTMVDIVSMEIDSPARRLLPGSVWWAMLTQL
jgi:hypothetical protein